MVTEFPMFHYEKSGKDCNDKLPEKTKFKLVILFIFHFYKSGKYSISSQS